MNKPDIVFKCRKCGHLMFSDKSKLDAKIKKIINLECDNCGEEGYENWILSREGNYEKEYGVNDEEDN